MPLTPLDAENTKFRSGFRGYAREEVERFRATVIAALEDHIKRSEQLSARVAELDGQLARYREKEELLKDSIVLAQRTCDELIAAAHQKADAIRREALLEGDDIRRELAELRSQREQFEYAFHGLLSGFIHRLEQGNPRLTAGPAHRQLSGGEPREAAAGEEDDAAPAVSPAAAEVTASDPQPELRTAQSSAELDAPRPAHRAPAAPQTGAASRPKAPAEVDRDADIMDFSAALDRAPVEQPEWLREEPAAPADNEPPAEETAAAVGEELGAADAETKLPADERE